MVNISKILIFTVGLIYLSSVNCQIVKLVVNNHIESLAPSNQNYKRFVFSTDDVMVSFEIPEAIQRFNNQNDIEKINAKFGFNYKIKKYDFHWDDLFFSDSIGNNLIRFNTYFVFSSLNSDENEGNCCNPPLTNLELQKIQNIILKSNKFELINIQIGSFKLPLFVYSCYNHQYPYEVYQLVVKNSVNGKIFYFVDMNLMVNHIFSISFNFFTDKLIHNFPEQIHRIAKSVRLHKFTFSNTSLFDVFENNSGFMN